MIARIGGDEFAVLLPDTSAKAAEFVLPRLYNFLQEHNTNYPTENPLQISVGISTARDGNLLKETLKEADAAMYLQKRRKVMSTAAKKNPGNPLEIDEL